MTNDELIKNLEEKAKAKSAADVAYREAYAKAYPVIREQREKNLGKTYQESEDGDYLKIVGLTPSFYVFLVVSPRKDEDLSIWTRSGHVGPRWREVGQEESDKVYDEVAAKFDKLRRTECKVGDTVRVIGGGYFQNRVGRIVELNQELKDRLADALPQFVDFGDGHPIGFMTDELKEA